MVWIFNSGKKSWQPMSRLQSSNCSNVDLSPLSHVIWLNKQDRKFGCCQDSKVTQASLGLKLDKAAGKRKWRHVGTGSCESICLGLLLRRFEVIWACFVSSSSSSLLCRWQPHLLPLPQLWLKWPPLWLWQSDLSSCHVQTRRGLTTELQQLLKPPADKEMNRHQCNLYVNNK